MAKLCYVLAKDIVIWIVVLSNIPLVPVLPQIGVHIIAKKLLGQFFTNLTKFKNLINYENWLLPFFFEYLDFFLTPMFDDAIEKENERYFLLADNPVEIGY